MRSRVLVIGSREEEEEEKEKEKEEKEEKEKDLGDSRDSSWLDSPEAGEASSGCEAGMQIQLIQLIRFHLRPRISRQRQKYFYA